MFDFDWINEDFKWWVERLVDKNKSGGLVEGINGMFGRIIKTHSTKF